MSTRREPDTLPCDQSLVVMGNSYDSPPTQWRTHDATCATCHARFVVTAGEQRFWYEKLRIPYVVTINRCRSCRGKQRAHRGIIARLSAVLPRIEAGTADREEQRDAVLTIADGMTRRLPTLTSLDIPILSSRPIIEKAAALVASLRSASRQNDDLLPAQIRFHARLGNAARAAKLSQDLDVARRHSPQIAKAIRHVEQWLENPTMTLRKRIADLPGS